MYTQTYQPFATPSVHLLCGRVRLHLQAISPYSVAQCLKGHYIHVPLNKQPGIHTSTVAVIIGV